MWPITPGWVSHAAVLSNRLKGARVITQVRSELSRYLRTETFGGALLLIAAAAALIWVNSPWGDSYTAMVDTRLAIPPLHLDLTLADWTKDGLLAIFFFVAGLELKRELVVGELADRKSASLPIIAAFGGVLLPALIAVAVGWGVEGMDRGWAIPVATDIAFALGVLALTGSRIPAAARVFLLSLAVVDDLIAIILIAVLFTTTVKMLWLLAAILCFAIWWTGQKYRVSTPILYVPVALVAWYALHEAGIHPTLAGVALGLLTRVRPDPDEDEHCVPAANLEHFFQPISAGFCVPVFALFASGVTLNADVLSEIFTNRLGLAIVLGLLVGKTVGIFGFAWAAIRLGLAKKPTDLAYRDMFALSVLGAIGFTVSLLVAELALADVGDGSAVELAKAAVLLTSLAASLVGSALLLRRGRVHQAARDERALQEQESD
ncbi:Sodium/proton antiporter nhaA [Nocardia otitidiscaviarum]|uniref:Na(+)/H(+) antiporter NhaA n=1 Tax=Nocardia otitidiscaviarum TaxID=1823 RepID=A0A378YG06_9NOCA|nr:Sodium/proton antiporter nhaA [Nocardia otitidiscaviarum]